MVKAGIVVKRSPGDYDTAESCRRYIAHLRKDAETPSLTAARVKQAEERTMLLESARGRAR
jgi:hypothetical protein